MQRTPRKRLILQKKFIQNKSLFSQNHVHTLAKAGSVLKGGTINGSGRGISQHCKKRA